MSAGLVVKIDNEGDRQGWIQIQEAFGIQEIYELPGLGFPFPNSIGIETVADVANFRAVDLVVVQPAEADLVQGTISLIDFEHPEEAVYVFGGTMTRLNQSDVRNALAEFVYIQAGDLFPSQAGAIILWDRFWKRGARP